MEIEDIDDVLLNFNQDGLMLLNVLLAFIMFGVALDLKWSDFQRILDHPKSTMIGVFSQLLALPVLTVLLVYFFQPKPTIALGMILIAACPGGNISNFFCHLAKGNTALSVSLTAISTSLSILITPISFAFWASFVPETSALIQSFSLEFKDLFFTIFLLLGVPLTLGLLVAHHFKKFTAKVKKPISLISMFIFLCFVVGALALNFDHFLNYVHIVIFLVFLHNSSALLSGFWLAKWAKLSDFDARAISVETGIQNSGLGLVIIFNFFDGLGGMALVAAWWGVWHIVSGFTMAFYWKRFRPEGSENYKLIKE